MRQYLQRDPSIKRAEQAVEEAEEALRVTVKLVQAECRHHVVYHWEGGPRRICPVCGLEEEGTHLSILTYWNPKGGGRCLLGPSEERIVQKVETPEEYMKHRVHV